MNAQHAQSPSKTPDTLVGRVFRFGELGVIYKVLSIVNDTKALVEVVESQERLEYPIARIFSDPLAS